MAILSLFAFIAIYFLPSIISRCRKHKNALAIEILNFFLGWTFIGWVVALIWAVANDKKD